MGNYMRYMYQSLSWIFIGSLIYMLLRYLPTTKLEPKLVLMLSLILVLTMVVLDVLRQAIFTESSPNIEKLEDIQPSIKEVQANINTAIAKLNSGINNQIEVKTEASSMDSVPSDIQEKKMMLFRMN